MILLATTGLAATLRVDPGDPSAHSTLGAALAVAQSGDELEVAPGTYAECLSLSGWMVLVRGTGGSAATVLAPPEGCSAAVYAWGGNLLFEGFTVRNPGGRAFQVHYATLLLDDVVVESTGNSGWSGGGLYLEGSQVTVTNARFVGNTAYEGGAIYLYAWNDVEVVDSAFESNVATAGWGGAINAYYDNSLTLSGSTFTANTTAASGGALGLAWYSDLAVSDSTFTDNVAAGSGGAVMLYANDGALPMPFTDVDFSGNEASTGSGGAIQSEWWNNLVLTRARFSGNTAAGYGGAVGGWYQQSLAVDASTFEDNLSAGAYGGAVFWYPNDTSAYDLVITGSAFTGNAAPAGPGGAVWTGWVRDATLHDSTFDHNAGAWAGGAVEAYVAASLDVARSRFCANTATGSGGGLSSAYVTTDTWTNSVFVGNAADVGGGGYRYSITTATSRNNSFVGNTATSYGAGYYADWAYGELVNVAFVANAGGSGVYTSEAYTPANSVVAWDGWYDNAPADAGGYFWLDADEGHVRGEDPRFAAWDPTADCAAQDLHLRGDSPFRDAGDPAILDLDGSRSDIGAWGGPGAPVEDHDGDGADSTVDCADGDAGVGPGAPEACGGGDEDCDGEVDEAGAEGATAWYTDADGDGWGDATTETSACVAPAGAVATAGDCDDGDAAVSPDGTEVRGDGIDQDCSGADLPPIDDGDDPEQAATPSGCGCASSPGPTPWLLLPAALLLRRRRASPPDP